MSTAESSVPKPDAAVPRVANPFANSQVVAAPGGAGGFALAQREVAEVSAGMLLARQFPRDPMRAMDRVLNGCARPSLAEEATYVYSRGGEEITGPSIRLAEHIAQNWGNMKTGVEELSRASGMSEVRVYCYDLETGFNDEKKFWVKHWRDTKKGGYAVSNERDIYEVVANVAARRKRACILAVLPGDIVEAAVRQCEVTLQTRIEVTAESIKAMLDYFEKFGVTKEMIEKRIQRHVDSILPAQMLQLKKIVQALKDGMGAVSDYFEVPDEPTPEKPEGATQTQAVKDKLKGKQSGAKSDGKPAPGEDLGGHVPHYSKETAIAELKAAKEITALEKSWAAIALDYQQSKRELEPDVDEAYKQKKTELQKL